MDLEALSCLACGGNRFEVLLAPAEMEDEARWLLEFHRQRTRGDLKDHADFTQSSPAFVTRCLACGSVMRNPQPTPARLRRLYQRDQYGAETLRNLLSAEKPFFQDKACWAVKFVTESRRTKPPRVLEIGSFVGAFLLAANSLGWESVGVDVGEETSAFCRSMDLDVRTGDVGDVDLGEPFDAVFVWNTFDQVNRPHLLLARIRSLIAAGGVLIIRFPNGSFESACLSLRSTRHREFAYRAQAYNNFLTYPYLVGYTPDALGGLLAGHGFAVREVVGDTIVPLATPETEPWAIAEELRVKRAVRRAFPRSMPWIDLVATKVDPWSG